MKIAKQSEVGTKDAIAIVVEQVKQRQDRRTQQSGPPGNNCRRAADCVTSRQFGYALVTVRVPGMPEKLRVTVIG